MTAARELRRLAALHEYELLDTPAGDELEAVVRVAAGVAGVPFGTLNLIDESRQCQLTTTGFEGSDSARSDSMCAVRFRSGEVTYLPDASLDAAYAFNPWVTGMLGRVRFYFSAPLVTPQGHALGSLCVFDEKRHELTDEQMARLRDLARVLVALFECRRQSRLNRELATEIGQQHDELERAHDELERAHDELERAHHELERAHAERAATIAELRRSNHELEQFAGVVSHDLAAPLTVVNGCLELLGERFRGTDGESERWIGSAVRAVGRMHGLITALLSYARAGHAPLRAEPTRLGDLVELALADLRGHLDGATVTVQPDLPAVEADPTLVRQLLQNLLGNALKYRRPDRPCRIEVRASRDDQGWRVAVADNGVGIPRNQRERIFEMFAQVDPSTGKGYGVGLSTCERIVDRHGGRIVAVETPGGGTTVVFTLPVTDAS